MKNLGYGMKWLPYNLQKLKIESYNNNLGEGFKYLIDGIK